MRRCKICGHESGPTGPRHHKGCRYWIDSEENQNCTFVAIEKNGPMTLRQIAEIENISHVAVRDIQKRAIKKIILQVKKDEYI